MKPIEKPEAGKRHNKVGFRWVITRLGIINKGTMFSILRNELGYGTHQKPENATGYDINADRVRAQRHSLILKDVEYLIEAVIEVPPETRQRAGRQVRPSAEFLARNKYHQMFLRRARAGSVSTSRSSAVASFPSRNGNSSGSRRKRFQSSHRRKKFGMIFRDFDYEPMWDRWEGGPRPNDGWRSARPAP